MGVMQGTVTSSIERHFPVNELSALARVERPDLARPPLYLHKWWARRFGSVFRSIIHPGGRSVGLYGEQYGLYLKWRGCQVRGLLGFRSDGLIAKKREPVPLPSLH